MSDEPEELCEPHAEEEPEDYDPDLITLEDESGDEHVFEVVDAADLDGVHYLAVAPYSGDPAEKLAAEAEIIIMRVGEENGEEFLDIVEDKDELRRSGEMFVQRLSEVYDIDLDDLDN